MKSQTETDAERRHWDNLGPAFQKRLTEFATGMNDYARQSQQWWETPPQMRTGAAPYPTHRLLQYEYGTLGQLDIGTAPESLQPGLKAGFRYETDALKGKSVLDCSWEVAALARTISTGGLSQVVENSLRSAAYRAAIDKATPILGTIAPELMQMMNLNSDPQKTRMENILSAANPLSSCVAMIGNFSEASSANNLPSPIRPTSSSPSAPSFSAHK